MSEKKLKYFFILILCVFMGCYRMPEKISTGRWSYKLFVNKARMGSAVISNRIVDGNYVSVSELNLGIGEIINSSKQVVTETRDFKPLRLEIDNKINNAGNVHETKIIAVFRGRNVDLTMTSGKQKTAGTSKFEIGKEFVLEGNFFMAKLIEGKFKEGLEIKARVYEPSIELEEPILMNARVVGVEDVEIDGVTERLIHISQSIEQVKNIDVYIDSNGILKKGIIEMLNMKIELIRE